MTCQDWVHPLTLCWYQRLIAIRLQIYMDIFRLWVFAKILKTSIGFTGLNREYFYKGVIYILKALKKNLLKAVHIITGVPWFLTEDPFSVQFKNIPWSLFLLVPILLTARSKIESSLRIVCVWLTKEAIRNSNYRKNKSWLNYILEWNMLHFQMCGSMIRLNRITASIFL